MSLCSDLVRGGNDDDVESVNTETRDSNFLLEETTVEIGDDSMSQLNQGRGNPFITENDSSYGRFATARTDASTTFPARLPSEISAKSTGITRRDSNYDMSSPVFTRNFRRDLSQDEIDVANGFHMLDHYTLKSSLEKGKDVVLLNEGDSQFIFEPRHHRMRR